MYGLSEKYQLADVAAHLLVSVDTWFEWIEEQMDEHVKKVKAMSVEDMLKGKRVSVRIADETSTCWNRQFHKLSLDAGKVLREKTLSKRYHHCCYHGSYLRSLNLPAAIQQKQLLGGQYL